MGVTSIIADNLSPLVSRILNKKEVNIFGQVLSYFFVGKKKNLLVGASGMLWTGQWVGE